MKQTGKCLAIKLNLMSKSKTAAEHVVFLSFKCESYFIVLFMLKQDFLTCELHYVLETLIF